LAKSKLFANDSSKYSEIFTWEDIKTIYEQPHLLGHLMGFDRMTPMHSEWIHYLFLKDNTKVKTLMCHRGSFKTTSVITGIPWRFLFFPEDTLLYLRQSFSDAQLIVIEIVKQMKKPEIRELFRFVHGEYPELVKERLGDGIADFSFKKKSTPFPSITAKGATGQITGFHSDCILIDDLETQESRYSAAKRIKDVAIFNEVTANIVNRGDADHGFVRLIGTPWSDNENSLTTRMPKPKKYYLEDTKLISQEELEEIRKTTTPQQFACNYLLEFIPSEKQVFKNPKECKWGTVRVDRPKMQIDFAFSGTTGGDHTACTVMANRNDGCLQAIGFLYKGNGLDWIPQIAEIYKRYRCVKVAVESNRDSGWGASLLRKAGLNVYEYNESTNKNIKIGTYGPEVWDRVYWDTDDGDPGYMSQIIDWVDEGKTTGMPDDAPDSYASLVRAFFSKKGNIASLYEW
jgi:hypothetical protein